ncbi:MAG: phosphatase PAP2 family protein [Pseudomonadota bacterium]
MIRSILIFILCFCLLVTSLVHAGDNPLGRTRTGDVGDALQIVLPATAFAISLAKDDKEGRNQFLTGFATTLASSYVLKESISKERPDGRDDDGFPSSHTAVSFQAAGYLHERYGWKWGLPAYIAAAYVGHSRVHDDRHDEIDVISGALLGLVTARIFTTAKDDLVVTPQIGEGYVGLSLYREF